MSMRAALTFSLVALMGTFACTNEPPAPAPVKEGDPALAPSEDEVAATAPKIAADEAVFDFGSVAPSGKVEHVFTIRNVGDADLHIDHVKKT